MDKSWCRSWLGYHSRVYYKNLKPVPLGVRFSQEWGLIPTSFVHDTHGDWQEYDSDSVIGVIYEIAGNPDLTQAENLVKKINAEIEDARLQLTSIITINKSNEDLFLDQLQKKLREDKIKSQSDFVNILRPTGQVLTRDTAAMGQGFQTPPHILVLAQIAAIGQPIILCKDYAKMAEQIKSHLTRQNLKRKRIENIGTKVFIGHGRSLVWKDLKDFINDRLGLQWDEFNRVSIAGIPNITRLSQMLEEASIAFLVLTGEDEHEDKTLHARMNVIHEAGMFQGRLGFTKAIILIEEGCEEFSNIHGLGQLRFPKGKISAIFEEIRLHLERENLLSSE